MSVEAAARMSYRRENVKHVWREILPLLELHFDEVAHFKDVPLAPDRELYVRADEAGMLRVYTVRELGVLVGYAVFQVTRDIHFGSALQAREDVIFLKREVRGPDAISFVRWCDRQLREEGVQFVRHHVSPKRDWSVLLLSMGYEAENTTYVKRLD